MIDKNENQVSESSSGMIESERLAQILDDMINEAATKKDEDILVIPENKESQKKPSSDIDGIIVIPQNAPAVAEITPSQEPVEEEEPAAEADEPQPEEESVEPIEVEEPATEEVEAEEPEVEVEESEPEAKEEPEIEVEETEVEAEEEPEVEIVEDVVEAPAELFVKAENVEENCLKTPKVRRKLASAAVELLNNIDANLSRIIVSAPSEKEDSSTVALLVAMGLSSSKKVLLVNCKPSDTVNEYFSLAKEQDTIYPTDMENLFFMSAGEDMSFDTEGFDTVVYAMGGDVNTADLTDGWGVLLAVKPKVTTYGAYRKVLKSLKKSQAKILGAVIV